MLEPRQDKQVPSYVQTWAEANRRGDMTFSQWLELVTQPMVPLLLLVGLVLILFAFNPVGALRIVGLARFGGWLIGLSVVGLAAAAVIRGVRYRALPIRRETLYGGEARRWRRGITTYTPKGHPVVFMNRVGGRPQLQTDEPYTVYYLEDGSTRILLSYTPATIPPPNTD